MHLILSINTMLSFNKPFNSILEVHFQRNPLLTNELMKLLGFPLVRVLFSATLANKFHLPHLLLPKKRSKWCTGVQDTKWKAVQNKYKKITNNAVKQTFIIFHWIPYGVKDVTDLYHLQDFSLSLAFPFPLRERHKRCIPTLTRLQCIIKSVT